MHSVITVGSDVTTDNTVLKHAAMRSILFWTSSKSSCLLLFTKSILNWPRNSPIRFKKCVTGSENPVKFPLETVIRKDVISLMAKNPKKAMAANTAVRTTRVTARAAAVRGKCSFFSRKPING